MDWIQLWKEGQTGFHRDAPNETLLRFADRVLTEPSRVLVPLCGASVDLAWLAARGHEVVGIELSDIAVGRLFAEAGRTPVVEGALHRTPGLSVFNADLFTVTPEKLASAWKTDQVSGREPSGSARFPASDRPVRVWDRAAMIALPPDVRGRYVDHLRRLAGPDAVVLLETIVYDPSRMEGPPFSIDEAEVRARYASDTVTVLERADEPVPPRWAENGLHKVDRLVFEIKLASAPSGGA